MAIFFFCPACKNGLTRPDDRAGTSLECPTCKTSIVVPASLPPLPGDEPKVSELPVEFLSPDEEAVVADIVEPEPVPSLPALPPKPKFVDYTPDMAEEPGTPDDSPGLEPPEPDEDEEESDEETERAERALLRRTREYKRRRARRRAIFLTALPLILLVILWLLYPGVMERWRYYQSHPAPNSPR